MQSRPPAETLHPLEVVFVWLADPNRLGLRHPDSRIHHELRQHRSVDEHESCLQTRSVPPCISIAPLSVSREPSALSPEGRSSGRRGQEHLS